MFFYKKIKEALRKFFGQPVKAKLLVIPPIPERHDFRHGLGYFFEEVLYLYDDDLRYLDLRQEVVFIFADEDHKIIEKGVPKTTIIVDFEEDETNISKIQEKLKDLGLKTEVLDN